LADCEEEMKAALTLPTSDDMARSRIKTFIGYVKRIGEQHVEAGGTKHGRPKFRSVPFFLSYFWQIHDRQVWPVYYTNSVNTMTDLNLWQPPDDVADRYLQFKRIHEELCELFSHKSGKSFHLYDVEHVFWMKGDDPKKVPTCDTPDSLETIEDEKENSHLPDSYVRRPVDGQLFLGGLQAVTWSRSQQVVRLGALHRYRGI
jgi:hypothetical protein